MQQMRSRVCTQKMTDCPNLQLSCILKTPVKEVLRTNHLTSLHATHTNKQTQQSSWFFGSHYKTTSFVGNGRIPVLRVSDIGEFPNLKEQVGHIRKHLRGDMKPPKRFHQSGNPPLNSERNKDVTDKSFTSKMAKFVVLDGHFTKFSWVLNKNIATSPCVPLLHLTPFESSSPSSSWPTNPICAASLTEKCFQYFFSWLSAIAPRPRVALQLPPFRCWCRVLQGLDQGWKKPARDAKSPNSRKRLVLEMTLQQKILIHVWFRWWWAKDGVSYYRLPRKDCNRTWWDKSERKRYELSLITWFSIWWLEKNFVNHMAWSFGIRL